VVAVKFENGDDALWIVALPLCSSKRQSSVCRATSSHQSPVQLLLGEAAAECRPEMTLYKLWCCHRAGGDVMNTICVPSGDQLGNLG